MSISNRKNEWGLVFNIQKFCIHDGPGIRTTVFLKGCPLRCKWCSNPESQSSNIQLLIEQDRREKIKAIDINSASTKFDQAGNVLIDQDFLLKYQLDFLSDLSQIKQEGKWRSVDEVLDICLHDIAFYEESGGGVTLSGGEPLMQIDFCLSLLKKLQDLDIHTAIETTGFVQMKDFARAIPLIDLILFDLKHWNTQIHKAGTGVSNTLILENLKVAIGQGSDILIRIPVIPDFNNTLTDAKNFTALLKSLKINRAQLLPFHQLGEIKYDNLGKEYAMKNFKPLYEEDLKDYQNVFLENGIEAFF